MFHKILVAVEDAATDRPIFETALALAASMKAKLLLLHVLAPDIESNPVGYASSISYYYPSLTEELIKDFQQEWQAAEQHGLEMLHALLEEATRAGVETEVMQCTGEPSRNICAVARDSQVNLLVMGRRGLAGIGELFLGSVSNYVLHHAPCSVLIVQGRTVEQAAVSQREVATQHYTP